MAKPTGEGPSKGGVLAQADAQPFSRRVTPSRLVVVSRPGMLAQHLARSFLSLRRIPLALQRGILLCEYGIA